MRTRTTTQHNGGRAGRGAGTIKKKKKKKGGRKSRSKKRGNLLRVVVFRKTQGRQLVYREGGMTVPQGGGGTGNLGIVEGGGAMIDNLTDGLFITSG